MTWAPKNPSAWKLVGAFAAIVFLGASLCIPDWIERTTGFDLDNDSGRFEWGLSLAAVAVFVVASWFAAMKGRRRAS
jgi:hypothetical protein